MSQKMVKLRNSMGNDTKISSYGFWGVKEKVDKMCSEGCQEKNTENPTSPAFVLLFYPRPATGNSRASRCWRKNRCPHPPASRIMGRSPRRSQMAVETATSVCGAASRASAGRNGKSGIANRRWKVAKNSLACQLRRAARRAAVVTVPETAGQSRAPSLKGGGASNGRNKKGELT